MDQALGEPRYAAQKSPRIVGGFFCVSELATADPQPVRGKLGRPRRTSGAKLDRDELAFLTGRA